jgi:S-methylmethionine-dependent homocysteine/selenocysteine methylase
VPKLATLFILSATVKDSPLIENPTVVDQAKMLLHAERLFALLVVTCVEPRWMKTSSHLHGQKVKYGTISSLVARLTC